jgi:hypothetical protein
MTLGEFSAWARGQTQNDRRAWDRTAAIMALTANIHSGRKGRSYTAQDFHPYDRQEQHTTLPTEEQIEHLKQWPASLSSPSSST